MQGTLSVSVGIAMWSGPRNISTALMRSWENRPDCGVVDEPFYACYLRESGLQHPCREEILRAQSDQREVVVGQLIDTARHTDYFYQKHMTHHMPEGTAMSWCRGLRHCFLIRDPAQVIASYLQKMPTVSEQDIGIARQHSLFEEITALTGTRPLVIDCNEVLRNPASVLEQLCRGLGVEFLPQLMLNWPRGRRPSDGVWAHHWYQNVEQSTGFAPFTQREPALSAGQRALALRMQPHYDALACYRLRP